MTTREFEGLRDVAVARSLRRARVRAEKRAQKFVDAALALMKASDGMDFTVQEVVDGSGLSLRAFYQYFAGKHELQLAVFDESVRGTARHLAACIGSIDDPLERLRTMLSEYNRLCTPGPAGRDARRDLPNPVALAEFVQALLTEHPREAALAHEPLVALAEHLLDDAVAAGALRSNLDHRRLAGVLLNKVMFKAFAATISGTPGHEAGEDLWELVLRGIAAPRPERTAR